MSSTPPSRPRLLSNLHWPAAWRRLSRALTGGRAGGERSGDAWFAALFAQVADGVLVCTDDGHVLAGNPAAADLFGCDAAGLAGASLADLMLVGSEPCTSPSRLVDGEVSIRRGQGVHRVELRARPVLLPKGRHWMLHLRDTAERWQAEERLTYLANFDSLTGLPNRALFRDRLELAMARARRTGRTLALMFIDLDRFKIVNDSLGARGG